MSDEKYTSINRDNAVGRIEFSGGKAVWQWSQDTNDSTSILIKSLDNPELQLEATQRTPIQRKREQAPTKTERSTPAQPSLDADDTLAQLRIARGSSFDPYNSG